MRRIAISVAVSRVTGFPVLTGAIEGGRNFSIWAAQQGFEVHAFDDDNNRNVAFSDIHAAVGRAAETGDVSSLFFYFAGHGLYGGFQRDLLLLSGARETPGASIDLVGSVDQARQAGIPHVAFFVDACRTNAGADREMLQLSGLSIFDRLPEVPNQQVEVDQFYATVRGNPAWERQPTDNSVPPFGIYTRCLLGFMTGEYDGALEPEPASQSTGATRVLLANRLAFHLRQVVPAVAMREVGHMQFPDSIPGSYWTNYIARHTQRDVAGATDGARDPNSLSNGTASVILRWTAHSRPDLPREFVRAAVTEESEQPFGDEVRTIVGANDSAALVTAQQKLLSSENPVVVWGHDDTHGSRVQTCWPKPGLSIIDLANGLTCLVSPIPGYVLSLRTGAAGVEHLAYLPEVQGRVDLEVAHLISTAGALAQFNAIDGLEDVSHRIASHGDAMNPTVAILLAYQFARHGQIDKLSSLSEEYQLRHGSLPGDIALLLGSRSLMSEPPIPLMSEGWRLLAGTACKSVSTRELLHEVRPHLTASAWTTFTDLDRQLMHQLFLNILGD